MVGGCQLSLSGLFDCGEYGTPEFCGCVVDADCPHKYVCEDGGCSYLAPRCADLLEETERPDEAEEFICEHSGSPPGMVAIPCGSYRNGPGSQDHGEPAAREQREISAFWLDEVEVTVGRYRDYLTAEGRGISERPDTPEECNYFARRDGHPMNCISWCQAAAYCRWAGKRLPSEWEWEWAARNTSAGTTYPWGDTPQPTCELANISGGDEECVDGTSGVRARPDDTTTRGVIGLGGNVSEFTNSWLGDDELYKVVRGGSFAGPPSSSRADVRERSNLQSPSTGFRCAL